MVLVGMEGVLEDILGDVDGGDVGVESKNVLFRELKMGRVFCAVELW